jgi:tellurite resistance protein/uncharacterized protein (DUF697 family)
MLTPEQSSSLTAIALFAAFAEGGQSDVERQRVKQIIESLSTEAGEPSMSDALRRVLFKQTTIAQEAAKLTTPELREMAWEAALSVCEADGKTSPTERAMLDELSAALGRDRAKSTQEIEDADSVMLFADEPPSQKLQTAVAAVPLALGAGAVAGAAAGSNLPAMVTPPALPVTASSPDLNAKTQESDKTILRYSILTAAIELLPQGLASVAIIPLQTKMVHSIAGIHGYPLSASMIKEFIATVGVGAAGQVVESYARKFLGQLAKQFLGKTAGNIAKTAVNWGTGPIMTFATTYAMGQVARQYYAGGRKLSAIDLKTLFSQQVEKAKGLYSQYEPQVMQTAKGTSSGQIMNMLRGS